jgi:hypothetical protein
MRLVVELQFDGLDRDLAAGQLAERGIEGARE